MIKQLYNSVLVGSLLAVRSLQRGGRGTMVLIIVMLAMVFVNLNIFGSLIRGMTQTLENQIVTTLTGHILIEPEDGEQFISRADELEVSLNRVPGVADVSSRLKLSAEIEQTDTKHGRGTYPGIAINPGTEITVTNIHENLHEGRFLQADDDNGIVLGSQVAGFDPNDELAPYALDSASAGDTVQLSFINGVSKEFEVVGIVDNRFVQADNRFFITDTAYQAIFAGASHNASEMAIRLTDSDQLDSVAGLIEERDFGVNVTTWKDAAGLIETIGLILGTLNNVISVVSIVVAGFMIFIVMYIDVLNRKKQIGILRAIGISDSAIAISYIIRAFFYTIIGIAIGTLLMKFGVLPLFEARPLATAIGDVTMALDVTAMQIRSLIMVLVAFLGAFVPILYALRISIVDAIWGE